MAPPPRRPRPNTPTTASGGSPRRTPKNSNNNHHHHHRRRRRVRSVIAGLVLAAVGWSSFQAFYQVHHPSATWLQYAPENMLFVSPISISSSLSSSLSSLLSENENHKSLDVFYHIYIPPPAPGKKGNQTNVFGIVKEQLSLLQASSSAAVGTVYYTTVGGNTHATADVTTMIQSLCQQHDMSCRSTTTTGTEHQFRQGHEEVTLDYLHSYCVQHPNRRVGYIHTKGSFHDKAWNGLPQEAWRQVATQAVVHPHCVHPPNATCNVCSFLTTLWPFLHTPGNMFTADCAYVQQLLPPTNYSQQLQSLLHTRQALMQTHFFESNLFDESDSALGRHRYAAEHWIMSHPTNVPCDLSNGWRLRPWQLGLHNASHFEWGMQPKHPATLRPPLVGNPTLRLKQWYLLGGNLLVWLALYHQAPPSTSWMWSWFPDGQLWKTAVEQYGIHAVSVMLSSSSSSVNAIARTDDDEQRPRTTTTTTTTSADTNTANNNNNNNNNNPERGESPLVFPDPKSPWTIFYNIYIPPTNNQSHARSIVTEQLSQIGNSYAVADNNNNNVTLYYNTIGSTLKDDTVMNALCEQNRLQCVLLQRYEQGFEEKTLSRVYEFCQQHPTFRVIYIHNKGSFHLTTSEKQAAWRRHMTRAVTSEHCLNDRAAEACDVCGLVALPWPFVHYSGNFFTAQCAYVKQLVPPNIFGDRMLNITASVLVRRLQRQQFLSNLFAEKPYMYGIGRYASEHWIGSHPSINACDLSTVPNRDHWYEERAEEEYVWAQFPRYNIEKEWSYVPTSKLTNVLSKDRLRFREYYLLAGNLFRWHELYGEAPPATSWIWKWFPDGEQWKQAVDQHGLAQAVDMLSLKYAPTAE